MEDSNGEDEDEEIISARAGLDKNEWRCFGDKMYNVLSMHPLSSP